MTDPLPTMDECAPDQFAIAIDGPAAAGKSTVASLVADQLGAIVFDTGILYRAVALAAVEDGIEPSDEAALARVATDLDIAVRPPTVNDGRIVDVHFRGKDVTWDLRSPDVDRVLSPIAALPAVRGSLLEPQRRIGHSGRVIVVGRDIGTVVMPDADLKVFLEASPEERARRRFLELAASGNEQPYDDVLSSMIRRDRLDSERALSPLKPADDAVIVDSDDVPATDVASRIVAAFLEICCAGGDGTEAENGT